MSEEKKVLGDEELEGVSGGVGGKYMCSYCNKAFSSMIKAYQHSQICESRPDANDGISRKRISRKLPSEDSRVTKA